MSKSQWKPTGNFKPNRVGKLKDFRVQGLLNSWVRSWVLEALGLLLMEGVKPVLFMHAKL